MDGPGIPKLVRDENEINFASPLDMGRITGKYMRVKYGDREDKICHQPAILSCLTWTRHNNNAHEEDCSCHMHVLVFYVLP